MQEFIKISTSSLPLAAVCFTVFGIMLFFLTRDNRKRAQKIKLFRSLNILETFIIIALVCGLIGYVIGKIGVGNTLSSNEYKAFYEFCIKVSIIMFIIDLVMLLGILIFKKS